MEFCKKYKNFLSFVAGEKKGQKELPKYWDKLKGYEQAKWLKTYMDPEYAKEFIYEETKL